MGLVIAAAWVLRNGFVEELDTVVPPVSIISLLSEAEDAAAVTGKSMVVSKVADLGLVGVLERGLGVDTEDAEAGLPGGLGMTTAVGESSNGAVSDSDPALTFRTLTLACLGVMILGLAAVACLR